MASTTKTQSNRFIVGTKSYFDQEMPRLARDFSEYDAVDRRFMPFSFNMDNSDDGHYQELQQKMMDFGWRLNEDEDGHQYFTHPTYQGTEYDVYYHTLKNGRSVTTNGCFVNFCGSEKKSELFEENEQISETVTTLQKLSEETKENSETK